MSDVKNLYYLGPNGSNSHNAVIKFLNICRLDTYNLMPQKSIKSVFSAIEQDTDSIAVLPIENSIEGLVRETIDNLVKLKDSSIKIQGELVLPIKHMLMSTTEDINKIKIIYSHPQAFAQCTKFLYEQFPNATFKEVTSTSYAAEKVAGENDGTIAAIANETCADIFNLNILKYNINDEQDNQTRFYILSSIPLKKEIKNKTALILSPKTNQSGSLCDILKVFAQHKINLSYIDSRPSKKHLGEYLFFIELDGLENDVQIKSAIEELDEYIAFIKILGSFSVYG